MTSGSLGLRRKLLKFIKGKEELCNTLYSFEVESQDWKEVQASSAVKEQDTPAARYFHAACAIDQSIYLYGGCTESNFGGSSDELWCFNTSTNTWKKISTIGEQPPALHGHSMTVIDHQTILLFGGSTDNAASRLSNDAYLLKTEGMVWSKLQTTGSPPFPRSFHTASIVRSASNPDEKLLYIFAGETYNVSSDLCALNLSNGLYKWSRPLFDSAFEHLLHSAVVVSDKLLVYGGLSFNQGYLADFFFVNTVSIRPGKTKNDHTFKLVLIGDSGVGKSCLMTRFVEDHFSDVHISTIGVDFKTVTTMVDGKIVKLHVWDTAGQERFANVTTHYYRNCDGAIVVYDVTNKDSFDAVDNWVDAVEAANGDGAVTLLFVGNKNDLADERQVSRKDGQLMAQRFSAPFIETSAKSSANVDITFLNLSKKLVRKKKSLAQREKKSSSSKKTGHVLLTDSNASAQDGEHTKCCK